MKCHYHARKPPVNPKTRRSRAWLELQKGKRERNVNALQTCAVPRVPPAYAPPEGRTLGVGRAPRRFPRQECRRVREPRHFSPKCRRAHEPSLFPREKCRRASRPAPFHAKNTAGLRAPPLSTRKCRRASRPAPFHAKNAAELRAPPLSTRKSRRAPSSASFRAIRVIELAESVAFLVVERLAREPRHVPRRDSQRLQRLDEPLARDRHERRHPARKAEQLEEGHAAAVARGEGDVVGVEDDSEIRAFLTEEQELRPVVLAVVGGRVDVRKGADAGGQGSGFRLQIDERVTRGDLARQLLDGRKLGGRGVDGAPERGVAQAVGEVADDEAVEGGVARARAKRAVEAQADGAGLRGARVDGAGVVVGAGVRLDAAAQPLGGAAETVEVGVADDGVDRAGAA